MFRDNCNFNLRLTVNCSLTKFSCFVITHFIIFGVKKRSTYCLSCTCVIKHTQISMNTWVWKRFLYFATKELYKNMGSGIGKD
jgi:hypothetical protein